MAMMIISLKMLKPHTHQSGLCGIPMDESYTAIKWLL